MHCKRQMGKTGQSEFYQSSMFRLLATSSCNRAILVIRGFPCSRHRCQQKTELSYYFVSQFFSYATSTLDFIDFIPNFSLRYKWH